MFAEARAAQPFRADVAKSKRDELFVFEFEEPLFAFEYARPLFAFELLLARFTTRPCGCPPFLRKVTQMFQLAQLFAEKSSRAGHSRLVFAFASVP